MTWAVCINCQTGQIKLDCPVKFFDFCLNCNMTFSPCCPICFYCNKWGFHCNSLLFRLARGVEEERDKTLV